MNNEIHPTAIVDGDVVMGTNNRIGPYAVLFGPLTLGDSNEISPHVTIGTPGQDTRNPRYDSSRSPIVIGSNNIVREFATIQKPCYEETTRIGDNVFIMHGAHIPHDAHLEDGVVVTPSCALGGIVTVMQHATIGMGATIHQRSIIGPYSMVATGSAVTKNVRPFSKFIPGKPVTVNEYAVKKFGFEHVSSEIQEYLEAGNRVRDTTLSKLFERYESLHANSGREEY